MNYLLEIATFNFQSALMAANAGADRIEICDNMHEGGTTPSYGTIKSIKQKIGIPVFAMLRVHGGDFVYTVEEIEVMLKDLALFKELECEGVVCGFLKPDGTVNKELTKKFVDLAYPLEVTFHRAFDRTVDAFAALEDVIDCGCQRILTSGQLPVAMQGVSLLKQLVHHANDRIIIMPGCGVLSNNIAELANESGARELHSSAKKMQASSMHFINPLMNEELNKPVVDVEEIKLMKQKLAALA